MYVGVIDEFDVREGGLKREDRQLFIPELFGVLRLDIKGSRGALGGCIRPA